MEECDKKRIFFLKLQYYGFENKVLITAKKANDVEGKWHIVRAATTQADNTASLRKKLRFHVRELPPKLIFLQSRHTAIFFPYSPTTIFGPLPLFLKSVHMCFSLFSGPNNYCLIATTLLRFVAIWKFGYGSTFVFI